MELLHEIDVVRKGNLQDKGKTIMTRAPFFNMRNLLDEPTSKTKERKNFPKKGNAGKDTKGSLGNFSCA